MKVNVAFFDTLTCFYFNSIKKYSQGEIKGVIYRNFQNFIDKYTQNLMNHLIKHSDICSINTWISEW